MLCFLSATYKFQPDDVRRDQTKYSASNITVTSFMIKTRHFCLAFVPNSKIHYIIYFSTSVQVNGCDRFMSSLMTN